MVKTIAANLALGLTLVLVVGYELVDTRHERSRRYTTLATFNVALHADTQRDLYHAIKEHYPYTFSAIDLTDDSVSSESACTQEMLSPLHSCIQTNCGAHPEPQLTLCGTQRLV